MITIQLHNLQFYSFHGIHEEEKVLGNKYELSADIQFHETQEVNALWQTIDYVDLFEIINQRMRIATPLLETVVMEIGNKIHEKYDFVRSITISIKKNQPPVSELQGSVGVTWHKEF